jgi:hypothetical protein
MQPITTLAEVRALPAVAYERRRFLPDAPGIYFALIDGEHVAYIGMATSLRSRWKGHGMDNRLKELGSVTIAYSVACGPGSLRDMESAAIQAFRPRLNFLHVPVESRGQPRMLSEAVESLFSREGVRSGDHLLLAEAAADLGLTTHALIKAITRQQIAGEKLGPVWVIHRSELDRFKALPRRRGRPPKSKAE